MKRSTFGAVILATIFLGVWAEAKPGCRTYYSPFLSHDVKYCVERSRPDLEATTGEPVVYFMHGSNGGAGTWVKNGYSGALNNLRKASSLKPMTFISFDTASYSFFIDHPTKEGGTEKAYETWFVEEFIPYTVKMWDVCSKRSCRGIMGESMGGFGAIQTALRHPELFSAVAVNSPALSPFENFRPYPDWVTYFKRLSLHPLKKLIVKRMFWSLFKDPEFFTEHNPVILVNAYNSTFEFPALYFDMGAKDEYGFNEGYELFKAALDRRGFTYTSFLEPDGHHDTWKRRAGELITFMQTHL